MKIYLAGPYSAREKLIEYAADVQAVGYTLIARWLDGTHEVVSTEDLASKTEADRARWALDDLEDIWQSDILVVFTAQAAGVSVLNGISGGRHIETGWALAKGKRVLLVGEPENVFHWLPGIERCATWHDALVRLARILVDNHRPTEAVSA